MNLWNETKSVPISQTMVWEAYKKVRSNHGSAGVDQISMDEFDADRSKHLYKLWNRLASGSYYPPPVKEVEIPKSDGRMRKLGIPTIGDRVAQMVIKEYLEPRPENIINSLLANSFLHYAMDKWLDQTQSSVKCVNMPMMPYCTLRAKSKQTMCFVI